MKAPHVASRRHHAVAEYPTTTATIAYPYGDINNLSFVQGGDPKVHRSVNFAEFRQFFIQRPFREKSLVGSPVSSTPEVKKGCGTTGSSRWSRNVRNGQLVSGMLLQRNVNLGLICASNQNPTEAVCTARELRIDIIAEASAVVEASGSARAA